MTVLDAPTIDDLVFTEIEERFDETIACEGRGCSAEATVMLSVRCCNHSAAACLDHYSRHRARFDEVLAAPGRHVRCRSCRHPFAKPVDYFDVHRVVPL